MIFELFEKNALSRPKKKIAVVNPLSSSLFEAVKMAEDRALAECILYGDGRLIEEECRKYEIHKAEIRDASETELAAELAVKDVRTGRAQLLMKGDLSTSAFMKPVLNRDYGLRQGAVLSHIALLSAEFTQMQPLFVADGGINIYLDLETRRAVTHNTLDFADRILQRPARTAFAAVVEEPNPKIPETVEAARLSEEFSENGRLAEGPIALDVIFSPAAAEKKHIHSRLSGHCDVIIMPNITAANFMVKQAVLFSSAQVGGMIAGAVVPLILLSRSDSAETKMNSMLMALQ